MIKEIPLQNTDSILHNNYTYPPNLLNYQSAVTNDAISNEDVILLRTKLPWEKIIQKINIEDLKNHIYYWISQNIDLSSGKMELHVDNTPLNTIYPEITKLMKFQIHRVIFTCNSNLDELIQILYDFEKLCTNTKVLECKKIVNKIPSLITIGDEFRFDINLFSSITENIISILIPIIPTNIAKEILNILLHRRFDIRVINSKNSNDIVEFTVQTLLNHPYAARRSWKLSKTINPNEYILETVETNTFPYLVDYVIEFETNGQDALRMWELFLKEFVKKSNNGTILNDSKISGRNSTYYGNYEKIKEIEEVKRVLSEYHDIAIEFYRLSS